MIYLIVEKRAKKQLVHKNDILGCNCSDVVVTTIFTKRKRKQERTVDALALGGDEGRGKLR